MRYPILLLLALTLTTCANGAHPGVAPAASAAAPDASWVAGAQRQIAAREYEASRNSRGLQAPNRAHALRTYFTRAGIEVDDRVAGGELLRLRLSATGRGVALEPVADGELRSDGARVEIARPGLVEWYENSPAGLEQGFTLAERPAGHGEIALELSLGGATATPRGDAVVLAPAGGRRLELGKLAAFDAKETALPARFEVTDAVRLRLVVDDRDAAYPIRIDPLLTAAVDAHIDGDQSNMHFGRVAGAGDVNGDGFADVIVGASDYDGGEVDEGAAFVFLGSAAGITATTTAEAATHLESNVDSAWFGFDVAGAGDVNGDGYSDIVVGAYYYRHFDPDLGNVTGAAFIFLGSAAGIPDGGPATAATRLLADQPGGSQFGARVASAGDVNGDGYADVIIGANFYPSGYGPGGAFIFLGGAAGIPDGGPPTADTRILAEEGSNFGVSVAGAGDVNGDGYDDVIVGDTWNGPGGAAFVYLGSASGIADGNEATAGARLDSDQAGARFGEPVAGAGDVNGDGYADVIIGANTYDHGQSDEGAAFLFLGSAIGIASGTSADAETRLESDQTGAGFGFPLAGAGDVNGDGYADVAVGAWSYDDGETDEGAVFVFLGSAAGIASGGTGSAAARLEADQAGAYFGMVAGAGDVNGDGYDDLVVGAPYYDTLAPYPSHATIPDTGAVFVYHGSATGIATGDAASAHARIEANQDGALLGSSVAGAGDVNGDGYDDLIVGAPSFDAGAVNGGAAFVFHGGPGGPSDGTPASAATQLVSDQSDSEFGSSVAGAGDVNGDGYADVIVGAPDFDSGQSDEGAAFVFLGSASGVASGDSATSAAKLESNLAGAHLGASVAGAGDVNGDGYADVIVGAPRFGSEPGYLRGAVFIFQGGATGIANGNPATAATALESFGQDSQFGLSVAGAGDVNGDGFADVIVGAPYGAWPSGGEGLAFVFDGGASGIPSGGPFDPFPFAAYFKGSDYNVHLGRSVAGAGDVNGDGYADVIVGADAGAYVFESGASGFRSVLATDADARLRSLGTLDGFGHSVASAGDVNGDGYADVIVGAPDFDAGGTPRGAAFVFVGSASGVANGWSSTAAARLGAIVANQNLGASVAGAGDLNGDGYADVVVGDPGFESGSNAEGGAFVFLGNGGGRASAARQQTTEGAVVPAWSTSKFGDGFRVSLDAHHPAGSGLVRGEFEACPAGVAFGNASCTTALSPAWVAVGPAAPDVVLTYTFAGLDEGALYHWRARVLYAPATSTQSGIAPPPVPAHGPWRRFQAQSAEADVRVIPEPGVVASLACGAALLGVLARRRPR